MTKEIKSNWLKALQSGDYTQGTGCLKTDDGLVVKHCCLGVLGEVLGLEISKEGTRFTAEPPVQDGSIYPQLSEIISPRDMDILYKVNDDTCDGEYTAVIPLIKKLETTD